MSRKKRESELKNNETYLMYYHRLRDMALNLFEWEGLPDEINLRFLELKMYEEGRVVFFKDDSMGGYLTLPVNYGGQLNVYGEPLSYFGYGMGNGYQKELTPDNSVIIWNNFSRTPIDYIIRQYAYRLYEITRTQDINVKSQKTPILIRTPDGQMLTLKNIYQQYDGNEPVIFGDKTGFDPDSITVLKTDAPFVSDKLQVLKNEIWNECMTFLGIGNAKQDKKERLVADEVAANDEQIEQARESMLQARQLACKQINDMFGLNVSVDYRLNNLDQMILETGEGENDEDK
jgi:hypothetical protein